jgi:UDP-N-acetylmuramyl pentapeptide phosphotransferase/UDP-N-acetylglucosamine-1-phosphate transferase
MAVLGAALAAAFMSAALTLLMCTAGRRWLSLDLPNARSLHSSPTPRGAGLAIVASAAAVGGAGVMVGGAPVGLSWAVAGALAVAAVSWLDDRRSVAAGWRLLVHASAATVFVFGALGSLADARLVITSPDVGLPAAVGLIVAIAWATNLYNFMDGMDGFAGGMTVIGFGACAVLAWQNDQLALATLFATIAGAAGGFLVFNLPPARIFMGDVGSSTLGFVAACLGLLGVWHGAFAAPAVLLVFSPFIVDASVTLLRRLLKGEHVWKPHRTHFYQRLAAGRCGVRRTLTAEYVLMTACGCSAVGANAWNLDWALVWAAWGCIYAVGMACIARLEWPQPEDQPVSASLV